MYFSKKKHLGNFYLLKNTFKEKNNSHAFNIRQIKEKICEQIENYIRLAKKWLFFKFFRTKSFFI